MIGPDLEENINIDTEVDFRKMEFIYNLNKKIFGLIFIIYTPNK